MLFGIHLFMSFDELNIYIVRLRRNSSNTYFLIVEGLGNDFLLAYAFTNGVL
jgi:hypothetical protein